MTSSRSSSSASMARRTATFLRRQSRQVQGFREPLAKGLDLTMIWIPPGSFWMGSPQTEAGRSEDEGPRHLVRLQGFFMGQTPVTQAQWREVAGWQPPEGGQWERTLEPNPSHFQSKDRQISEEVQNSQADSSFLIWARMTLLEGEENSDERPVEQVSWDDAMEFCRRLNSRLGPSSGRIYTLPSEAQWEYACRAGTTTPFAFGETLTTELANFNGNYAYANGPKGMYREQTTPVRLFPANAWGLHDMHGNVWEWCLAAWHASYEGAPEDGSAWMTRGVGEEKGEKVDEKTIAPRRLLRGGSWSLPPGGCRSALRGRFTPGNASVNVGFRVVCLPQDPSLAP